MIRAWHQEYHVPIHITEMIVPSSAALDQPELFGRLARSEQFWHRPWSEDTQAEWIEQYVTLLYSLPEVEAAVCWGVADTDLWADYLRGHPNEAYDLPWMVGQGWLRADWSPKPCYDRLLTLAQAWGLAKGA
jgi:hypothetical protein